VEANFNGICMILKSPMGATDWSDSGAAAWSYRASWIYSALVAYDMYEIQMTQSYSLKYHHEFVTLSLCPYQRV
jgi:hypothetical protein